MAERRVRAGVTLVITILAAEVSGRASDSVVPQLTRVLSGSADVAGLLEHGAVHSPTLAALRSRFEATSWRVLIANGKCPEPAAVGCLLHGVGQYEGEPILRILIDHARLEYARKISTIGHELQHAIEVAESSDVTDAPSMARLFRRIGTLRATRRMMTFETDAAQRAGERVLWELQQNPRRSECTHP